MKHRLTALFATGVLVLLALPASRADAATARQRLANVAVPAYCHMPAQRLHHGTTAAKYRPAGGAIEFSYGAKPASMHLGRTGTQLLAQYSCTAGGVGWPSVLVLYSRANHLLASLRLGSFTKAEHAQVDSWHAAAGHTVKLNWTSYSGAGIDVHRHHSTLTLSGSRLRLR